MPVVQSKLKGLMRQHGFSQKDISKYLDIAISTLNRKLNGEVDFTKTEIDQLLNLFEKSYDELFFENNFLNKRNKINN